MFTSKDASGWNTVTSLLLIVSSVLRLFFYYCKAFDEVFLFQSLFCILTQLTMTYIVVKVTQKRAATAHGGLAHRSHTLWTSGLSRFWAWTDVQSYFLAVGLLTAGVYALSLLFWRSTLYREALGTLALGIEASVPVPQALQNASRRSTVGLSAVLIICWAFGDAFKTVLALSRTAPIQFVLCGVFQLTMDGILLWQIYVLYPDKKEDDPPLLATGMSTRYNADVNAPVADPESPSLASEAEDRALLSGFQKPSLRSSLSQQAGSGLSIAGSDTSNHVGGIRAASDAFESNLVPRPAHSIVH